MQKNHSSIFIVIIILLAASLVANVFFILSYFSTQKEINIYVEKVETNRNIVGFNRLFVDIVLKNQGTTNVAYEDVLRLENAAVSTQDNQILEEWHTFLNSQTEYDAQKSTLNLLSMFANKVYNN